MSLLSRKQVERLIPFLPVVFSAGIVAASSAAQNTPPIQSSNEWLVIVGGLVTLLLEYQRRRMAENSKAIKVTQETTPELSAFEALQRQVSKLENSNFSLSNQVEMLGLNYRSVTIERDRARDEYREESEDHKETRKLLEDERQTNAALSRTIDRMELRISELERRIEKAESVKELATMITDGIKELIKKKTQEIEAVVSPNNPQTKPA